MLDVLAAIHARKGDAPQPRPATDKSVRAVAILIDGPDPDTYLCTISVHNSEPIHGVPATSMDYTGTTAVHVLLEPHTGRPVHVLGPAGDLPLGNIPTDSAGDLLTVTDRLIVPTSTGTYREDEAAWDRYSTMTFGGVADVWQQGSDAGLVTFVDSAFSTTDATSYTFTDVNLGAESTNRTIIVCAMTRASTGSVIDDITLDGNTGIEGIPGSGDPADLTFGAGAGASSRGGKWVRFAAPTGTTGTIVVPIVSGTAALCGIMVWSTPYAIDHDPTNTDHYDSGQAGWVGGVTLPADALALAAHYWETTEDTTWPAVFTDDALEAIGDGRNAQMAGAHTEETGYVEVDQTGTYTNALGSMIVYTLP